MELTYPISHLRKGSTSSSKVPWDTPWKINMEPTNHPFRKENYLPNLQGIMFHVNLQGCRYCFSSQEIIVNSLICQAARPGERCNFWSPRGKLKTPWLHDEGKGLFLLEKLKITGTYKTNATIEVLPRAHLGPHMLKVHPYTHPPKPRTNDLHTQTWKKHVHRRTWSHPYKFQSSICITIKSSY